MTFVKENLLEDTYSWANSTGKPDQFPTRMRFDRFSGDCVLRMLNLYNLLVMKVTLQEGQTMERWIKTELPLQAISEITVFNWLKSKHTQTKEKLV